jgi:hypothetical protein
MARRGTILAVLVFSAKPVSAWLLEIARFLQQFVGT